jgi:hypothetical protein
VLGQQSSQHLRDGPSYGTSPSRSCRPSLSVPTLDRDLGPLPRGSGAGLSRLDAGCLFCGRSILSGPGGGTAEAPRRSTAFPSVSPQAPGSTVLKWLVRPIDKRVITCRVVPYLVCGRHSRGARPQQVVLYELQTPVSANKVASEPVAPGRGRPTKSNLPDRRDSKWQ